MEYTLIRSNRKSITICITKDAVLEVRAPFSTPKEYIDKFVFAKEEWISFHLSTRLQFKMNKATFRIQYGDMLLFRGCLYPLIAKNGNRVGFEENYFYIPPNLPNEKIRIAVIQIYKMLANSVIIERVAFFANLMSLTPSAVKINSAKTHWGSCSGRKSLNFSWRLIFAEDYLIDYVIVHELAHIIELNHSKKYWTIVSSIMPDYKKRQQGLNTLLQKLSNENWD